MVFLAAAFTPASHAAPQRLVTGGIVQGIALPDGGTTFLGIPYAAPPVGELRWMPPAPVISWNGVRDATKTGAPCLQRSYVWNAADAAASREDCLYLDVRSPAHKPTDRLPVMVLIHGGANRAGSGSGFLHSTVTSRGVVLVTFQYRLGTFGFLSLPALTQESPEKASGNYALLDQIAVLKWVKANIANFGGDPGNVTLFGHSAGSQDVNLLMLSPLARGLFHKVILGSGTAGFGVPPRSLAANEKIGTDLAKLMGVPDGPEGLKALRAASGDAILDATNKLVPQPDVDASFIWLQAVVDGWVIPKAPAEIMSAHEQMPVPMIVGNSEREFTVVFARENPYQWIKDTFGPHAGEALAFYGFNGTTPPTDDPVLGSIADQTSADIIFRCPASWVAEHQTELTPKVWRFQVSVPPPGGKVVEHGAELKYTFDAAPPNATLGTWPPIQEYWTNFAKTGDPNSRDLPHWPAFGKAKNYLDFTAQGPTAGKHLRGPLCRLLHNP